MLMLQDLAFLILKEDCNSQGKRRQWAVYYTGPQSFIITFSYSLALNNLVNFDWLVY